jgi:hypothetical protein
MRQPFAIIEDLIAFLDIPAEWMSWIFRKPERK